MKPIIVLIAVGIAGMGLGVGFLGAPTFDVVAQDVGVGETDLEAPIDTARVAFHVTAIEGNQGFFKNRYDLCFVQPDEPLTAGDTIFCKLTDMQDKVVAEGKHIVQVGGGGIQTHTITIDKTISVGSTNVKNIHDVTIVIQAAPDQ